MYRRYLYTIYLIIAFVFVSMLIGDYSFSEVQLNNKKNVNLAEAKLAKGEKLSFKEVNIAELELIPGVSDKMAENILEAREKVLCSDKSVRHPLELVHGVGKKKAKVFEQYLNISHPDNCKKTKVPIFD